MGSPNTQTEQSLGLVLQLMQTDLLELKRWQGFDLEITGAREIPFRKGKKLLRITATANPKWQILPIPLLPDHVRTSALRAVRVAFPGLSPWDEVEVEILDPEEVG